MKVRVRIRKSREDFDDNKRRKIVLRLNNHSEAIRRKELALQKSPVISTDPNLNRLGDRRGMYSRENPPNSDQMRKIRAMRRFYNPKMPVKQCNGCAYSSQCPQFKAGFECAFLPFLNAHKIDTIEDLFEYMKEMVGANMRRTHWALLAETMSGGAPSFETSEAFNLAFTQLKQLYEIATGADSTLEIEAEDGGVIKDIFGDLSQLVKETKKARSQPIELTPEMVKVAPSESDALTDSALDDVSVNRSLVTEFARDQILEKTGKPLPEVHISESK